MSGAVEIYSGKVPQVGSLKAIRLDAAFFNAHAEFEGEVRLTVLGDGQVLLFARSSGIEATADERHDPVLPSFVGFLEAQIIAHPNLITAADPTQLARISKLVK